MSTGRQTPLLKIESESSELDEKVDFILSWDKRFDREAYYFVMQSLNFFQESNDRKGHVSASELLDGIKLLAIKLYGPMSKSIFNHWGLKTTEDFGCIVFNLINASVLGKSDQDELENFKDIFDFEDVFEKNYDYSS